MMLFLCVFGMQALEMLFLMNKEETTMLLVFSYSNLKKTIDNFNKLNFECKSIWN